MIFFCFVSTEAPGVDPHWRCYASGDKHKTLEMGGEEARGGVGGICRSRNLAEPREMSSGAFQELPLGHQRMQKRYGWLQHRKEEHVTEIHC